MKLALLYTLLALIAALANIGVQDLVTAVYQGPYFVPVAMVAGNGVGLLAKYTLDKRYIFGFRARDARHDGQTFALYTLMGLATTAIFWGFELGFHHAFGTREMRYLGAGIGLGLGYLIKYHLDRRFVFRGQVA